MSLDIMTWIIGAALVIVMGALLSLTVYVRTNYAQALQKISAGKPQEALDLFMRVVGWQQKHVPSLWQLALLYLSMEKTDAAVRHLERIIKIMDSEPNKLAAQPRWEVTESEVLTKLSSALATLNKRQDAITAFKRLVDLQPNNKDARFELGKLYYSTREYGLCIPQLERVIQIDAGSAEASELLSHALAAQGSHDRAADVLYKRLATDRQNVNLWIRMANLYRTAKNDERQAEAWRVVMEITQPGDANHISAVVQLGKLAFLGSRHAEAIDALKDAIRLCPQDDTRTLKSVKYYLGKTYQALGQKAQSLHAFSEVYQMDRSYKDVRELLHDSMELLSDEDLTEEIKKLSVDDFTSMAVSIVEKLGFRPTSVEVVNSLDLKVNAKLEETGKDRNVLLVFQRDAEIDIGELSIRTFLIECEEKHVEYPVYLTTGGFSFEAQLKAKDHRMKLMPKRDFCEIVRKVRTAA